MNACGRHSPYQRAARGSKSCILWRKEDFVAGRDLFIHLLPILLGGCTPAEAHTRVHVRTHARESRRCRARHSAPRVGTSWFLSVYLSVTLYLTPRTSVRPRNDTIYQTGDEGQNICAVFSTSSNVIDSLKAIITDQRILFESDKLGPVWKDMTPWASVLTEHVKHRSRKSCVGGVRSAALLGL